MAPGTIRVNPSAREKRDKYARFRPLWIFTHRATRRLLPARRRLPAADVLITSRRNDPHGFSVRHVERSFVGQLPISLGGIRLQARAGGVPALLIGCGQYAQEFERVPARFVR